MCDMDVHNIVCSQERLAVHEYLTFLSLLYIKPFDNMCTLSWCIASAFVRVFKWVQLLTNPVLMYTVMYTLFFLVCPQGSSDLDEMVEKLGRKEPYIVLAEADEATEYHIYIENVCFVTTQTLANALVNVISFLIYHTPSPCTPC